MVLAAIYILMLNQILILHCLLLLLDKEKYLILKRENKH